MPTSLDFEEMERCRTEICISPQTGKIMLLVRGEVRGEMRDLLWIGRLDELTVDFGRDRFLVMRSDGTHEWVDRDDHHTE